MKKKQQQFNKAVINTSSIPSSSSTNTSNHASDTYPMESTLPFPIIEIQVIQPPSRPNIPTSIYNPLYHQQGVWTRDRIQKYYPLYPGLDNEIQSSSSSFSNSSVSTPTPLQPVTMKYSYQEVVNRIQQLTHSYNNSPYFHQKNKTTPN